MGELMLQRVDEFQGVFPSQAFPGQAEKDAEGEAAGEGEQGRMPQGIPITDAAGLHAHPDGPEKLAGEGEGGEEQEWYGGPAQHPSQEARH